MQFFTIFVGEPGNGGQVAITINLAHLIDVHHGPNAMVVRMSDGMTYTVAQENSADLERLLQEFARD